MWTFCISLRLICFFCCCHPCFLSSSSVARAYYFVDERRKNNDRFGFVESLRSFVPREIRKFIKCAPAEVLKTGRKCLSFIFIHEALEGDGKGDWRLGDQAHSQTVLLCRHFQAASVDVHSGLCQAIYLGVLCIINAFVRALICMPWGRWGWHSLISTEPCLFTAVTPGLPERCRIEQAQLEDSRLSGTEKNMRLVNFKLRGFVYVFSAPFPELVKF